MKPNLKYAQRPRAFLLLEAMIASVILAVAALGVVSLLLAAQQQQLAVQESSTAALLGQQLMEEIASKPFGASTPIVARPAMTYANQYNNYQDSTSAMTTAGGSAVSPGDGRTYSRRVMIANAAIPTGCTAAASDFQLVTVSVTGPSGQVVSISRLLTNVTWP